MIRRFLTRFNPRLPGGRRLVSGSSTGKQCGVSIHAFRGEGDCEVGEGAYERAYVSIHAFRGEGDRFLSPQKTFCRKFQSTPSGGKATQQRRNRQQRMPVSIHAFRGEGDLMPVSRATVLRVSIHAFRGEGDANAGFTRYRAERFQSTPSGGKATSVSPLFLAC